MTNEIFQFPYEQYDSAGELGNRDLELLKAAHRATRDAYAPYSGFQVGAAARLANGEILTGGNLENASFPAGICAERVVMSNAAARFPGIPIESIAVTHHSEKHASDHPIAPCGVCRQSLQEFAQISGKPIRLIMGGETGKVIIIPEASGLLPFAFKF